MNTNRNKNEKLQITNTPTYSTQMAKAFGKRVNDWLKLESTSEFIEAITRKNCIYDYQPVMTQMGSPTYGGSTWMHEDVALEFARWLSIDFRLWCNDHIKTLLRHGITATDEKIEDFLANPDLAIQAFTALKEERAKRRQLENQVNQKDEKINLLENEIDKTKLIVNTYNELMDSDGLLTTTQIAKCYGWTARKLNPILHSLGV